MEGQWHGKLKGRQVLRDPGWTCVLFVKTGGANQDIFIRVMFDTIREQSVVLHSVAVKGLGQGPGCELRDAIGAARHA